MATETARKGPMSPEEMVDLRDRELRVDEELVRRLVDEAKADYGVNLLEPHQLATGGWDRLAAYTRHRRRFLQVMGAGAKLRSNGKMALTVVVVCVAVFGALYAEPTHPWWLDTLWALGFAIISGVALRFFSGYPQVFARLYALERRDFTDPGFVTGWVRIWVPRLAFYFRPELWRGNDGHNGIANSDSVIVVSCGHDELRWLYDEAHPPALDDEWWDKDVWCEVAPGRPLTDFRTPADYYDLPPDVFTVDGTGMKHRRSWCRDILRSGEAFAAWEKGGMGFLQGRWPWFIIAGMYIIGMVCTMYALG